MWAMSPVEVRPSAVPVFNPQCPKVVILRVS